MNGFKKREKGEEAKYAKDEEFRFKTRVRRNKLLGQWAAEKMGFSEGKIADYATELVHLGLEKAGEDGLFAKIRADFDAANIEQSDHQIERTMSDLLETAKQQLSDKNSS
ncbi:MAG: DUF1476 domain-containing protein [Hyphomicrobiaceae bacterium]|nr:DUF1476 domain-containing protein [Hyphomicrobiaceae bacterium]